MAAWLVLEQYKKLPNKGKPTLRSNGVQEWTILAGVVVERDGEWECVALSTGLKAMPETIIANGGGKILHDMHAEILALRAFNRWILGQCLEPTSGWIEKVGPKFKARENLRVFLYVSAPPCGDASMSLFQGESWESKPEGLLIRGRNHYGYLGYLRTKPGRQDSELTLSKSCTDKLAFRQQTSILLGPTRRIVEPIYLTMLVCPVLPDFDRAFRRWPAANYFSWQEPQFTFADAQAPTKAPSPTSLVWVSPNLQEVIVNGVRQGSKLGSGKGASIVSRFEIAKLVKAIEQTSATSYLSWKATADKEYPPGWQRTAMDDFELI
ncbi:tRNA-specific adenosine deaminase 1 [Wickerhamiella sorbophila]|uniref:tRNA-specific adenosine deaminase 1 n=1 Tax=Wickerhamiella sorbophila TaxID=45607 RepID=A0A2T0FFP2_9ASCO|nr:tRNA-specific adenosine deaminase 1 [Wickerhamiella sorbophila]PRT53808.1 tRNA-specific adenosine deaminase 1 [Wickerhamiella sorbophila]